MHVSQVNKINFSSRNRVLNTKQLNNVREIAEKINRPPTVINHAPNFTAVKIGYIESQFEDVFFYNNNDNKTSELIIGKKGLTVDRESGEITKVDKPFFMPFKKLLRIADECFNYLNENFDNPQAVRKNCIMEQGYVDESDGNVYILTKKWIRR